MNTDTVNTDIFSGCVDQDMIQVTLKDGRKIEGSYMLLGHQLQMHFIHVKGGGSIGHVEGPFDPQDVSSVKVIKTKVEIFEERYERQRGEPVPGTLFRTRDGYEARLDRLARAAAREEDRKRRRQIEYQFHDVADEIQLAQTKRKWLLAVAQWTLYRNDEPTKIDLSGGCMVSAAKFQRPRPQDFDPDPKKRRARVPPPDHVKNDPISTANMKKAFNLAGFNARVSVLGEMTDDFTDLLVDFPGGKKKGRFWVKGYRKPDTSMEWEYRWEGNYTKTDLARKSRCEWSEEYKLFKDIATYGLASPLLDKLRIQSKDREVLETIHAERITNTARESEYSISQ